MKRLDPHISIVFKLIAAAVNEIPMPPINILYASIELLLPIDIVSWFKSFGTNTRNNTVAITPCHRYTPNEYVLILVRAFADKGLFMLLLSAITIAAINT
ncbi:hypothetical protein SPHINGOT1_270108 [Sphingomonas sp. T1]|nr:hypothetical protein SPHINGOT1_270108 [Sphingomonas sp. T1]